MTTPGPPGPPVAVPDYGFGLAPVAGRLDQVAPGVWRLTAPNPGLMTGPGTNTYLIGHGPELAVVDPGPADGAHLAAILASAASLGSIRYILVTHTHLDHAPGAAALAAATGATVIGFGPAENFAPDQCVGDGFVLTRPGISLRALHTPGHASDHLCWLITEYRMLLTGDHVMHGSTVVIRPPDGDLHTYLRSLALLRDAEPPIDTLAPGHGRLMDHVSDIVEALTAHRLARHARVAAALDSSVEGTVADLLPEVYADVTEAQLPVARFSLWAHLRALVEDGRAVALDVDPGQDTIESRWRSVPAA